MAAKAALIIGNNWAFACRNEIRVEGLYVREQGLALKEEDPYLKEQASPAKLLQHQRRTIFKEILYFDF